MEDLNQLRLITRRLAQIEFAESWQWRIEIDGAPGEFDFFAKDVTYGPIEIETEAEKIGPKTFTIPTGAAPVSVSMTMKDTPERLIYNWFAEKTNKIFFGDGRVHMPIEYLLNFRRYSLTHHGDKLTDEWQVIPTQLGDVTESREDPGFLEFPTTFVQFISLGSALGIPRNEE
jgi:hypothetical protein